MNSKQLNSQLDPKTWSTKDSTALYGIDNWSDGYFSISDKGDVQVNATVDQQSVSVSVMDIVNGMQERGLHMPAVLRIQNILDDRIRKLNQSFGNAMASGKYQGQYRGVFPIKVNQQCHVIEEIADYGRDFHHGFEAGSKAELIIALSHLRDPDSLIVCNGYKDAEFIELGLYAVQMGIKCFFVLETLSELEILLNCSNKLGIDPLIGVRIRSTVPVDGHWSQDSGDRSIFGLSTAGLMTVVEQLRTAGKLHCLQLLHCHLGSQIPNIRNVRGGVLEACRFYAGLAREGASMGYLDLGGGLAVDYEGIRSNTTHSMNYSLDEYCVNIIETITNTFDPLNIAHPVLITESGRATVAYSSMLLFNVLDVRQSESPKISATELPQDCSETLNNLYQTYIIPAGGNVQERYNDALFYRDEVRELFHHGQASLQERALAERLYILIMQQVSALLPTLSRIPAELETLPELLSDIYYGNFSLFQSLPDIWAIDQLFPIMPIHRLDEQPDRAAIFADLTCDCDGKIDRFSTAEGISNTLPVHSLKEGEEYNMGVFLVGAYQETLGDLHNLFGDTNVVNVNITGNGEFEFVGEFHGDSIADVLSYVEYEPKQVQEKFRLLAEASVRQGKISVAQRQKILSAFKESLNGYTYFERVSE